MSKLRRQTCKKPRCFLPPATKLGRGYIFTGVCDSVHRGVVSQHALQQVLGGWYPTMPCRFPGPHPRGQFRGIWPGGGFPGPHPRGKLRRILPGGSSGPHPGGCLVKGVCSKGVPGPGGVCSWGVSGPRGVCLETPPDRYCCGRYASYWNAFLLTHYYSGVHGFVTRYT